jgi:transposase
VALSVIERRYRAVMAVVDRASVSEAAAELGVSRQSVHAWVRRYGAAGLAGLVGSVAAAAVCRIRPRAVEAVLCALRRAHPRWRQRGAALSFAGPRRWVRG